MTPPDMVDGKIPYVLYNLGGSLANVIVSVLPVIFAVVFYENKLLVCAVIVWSVIGLLFAFMNGVPLKMK